MNLVYLDLAAKHGADPVAFEKKVRDISMYLLTNPNNLMLTMKSESGINPRAYNPNGGATGLIQFMPSTAKGLGTTTEALYNMTALQQLDYVLKYFAPFKGKLNSYFDVYAVTFFPLMLNMKDDDIVQSKNLSAEKISLSNPGIAKAAGKTPGTPLTKSDFRKYVYSTVPDAIKGYVFTAAESAAHEAEKVVTAVTDVVTSTVKPAIVIPGGKFGSYKKKRLKRPSSLVRPHS